MRIAMAGLLESAGSIVLFALDKGDPELLILASVGGLGAGVSALIAGLKRDSDVLALREKAREIKFSEQANRLTHLVHDLPQETFSGIWNNLQQIREEAAIEPDEFGDKQSPTFDAVFQAFADRAGESPEHPN